ncbi:MAG TPA: thiamine pyrophosphate-dependent enzyme [Candidatus Limnocylindria bacterium]|jgi:pyruvate/2-oxoglutarate/acetoin dehydrogenase E1 component/TPP-dependent pyruvate/acetoin dehydrogenase alpha subunit|nr:thiamine pyrophosphate-dependent enzyme [Candidatus Limnocylindria bacterium]
MKTGTSPEIAVTTPNARLRISVEEIIADYRLAVRSRAASELSRREVLVGNAPFGISGEGKEIAQLAMAKAFRAGDWRSGYYRDQTFMFAVGLADLSQYFAQLYADPDVVRDPNSAGRQMLSHFATRTLDERGRWKDLLATGQSASDLSPVGSQMPRAIGLAWASRLYRESPAARAVSRGFSRNGEEVCFATIGNAGTTEGVFWESLNAGGVLQIPLVISVWDDGYGISVPNELQTTKGSISALLQGFQRSDGGSGYDLHAVKGHDYLACCDVYQLAVERARREHVPSVVHVTEMTQPQGHSTSGSHERYKSKDRLRFEIEFDPIRRMREWILREELVDAATLDGIERTERADVERVREEAWEAYQAPIRDDRERALSATLEAAREADADLSPIVDELRSAEAPSRRLVAAAARRALVELRGHQGPARAELAAFAESYAKQNDERFNSHLYSRSAESPLRIGAVAPTYVEGAESVDGRLVLVRCFDQNLARDPRIVILGEDVGKLGDVNLVFEGLQAKHGEQRVVDTGIREATILGQGIGAALRGLRPIVDIQYVDYLLYALELASDDLATLHWRTGGGQKAPVLIRTKGHRLQGIWHTGSPMATIVSSLRGLHVAVPRDMTRAAGLYNTLLRGDDPAVVIEVLSGYRLKERIPENVGEFTIPLGVPEPIREGTDVTLVTYGALCRIALQAAEDLARIGIEAEIVDVQTLLPFDIDHAIAESVAKTRALLVVDEDVPGGASAYIVREVVEVQGAIDHLDVGPRTLTATANRVAVGNDGDYFSKPNREDIVAAVYAIMRERRPDDFPPIVPERSRP